ncbi:hypothetical protein BGX34_010775 [Mortierella sp. NVP85]|nr:hypothetical protein BGX34_010775 [Mortierella sp. NVP85]
MFHAAQSLKLPIYDDPEPEMVVKEEPTRLDEAIRVARQETDRQILGMKHHFQMVTNKVVDFEKEAESNIKSVLVKEEEVMPAAIYVIVAGFAGSIVARRRNILLRFLTPVAFSAMAFGYFFPASSNRLIARASQSDVAKYLPQDLQKQVRDLSGQVSSGSKRSANDALESLATITSEIAESAKEQANIVVEKLDSKLHGAEEAAKEAELETRAAKIRAEDALKRV